MLSLSLSHSRSKVLCRWLASLPVQLSQLGYRNPALSARLIQSIQAAASRGNKDLLNSLQAQACKLYGTHSIRQTDKETLIIESQAACHRYKDICSSRSSRSDTTVSLISQPCFKSKSPPPLTLLHCFLWVETLKHSAPLVTHPTLVLHPLPHLMQQHWIKSSQRCNKFQPAESSAASVFPFVIQCWLALYLAFQYNFYSVCCNFQFRSMSFVRGYT